MFRCHREPTLEDTLSDPMIQAVMAADGVDANELEKCLKGLARTIERRASPARSGRIEGSTRGAHLPSLCA